MRSGIQSFNIRGRPDSKLISSWLHHWIKISKRKKKIKKSMKQFFHVTPTWRITWTRLSGFSMKSVTRRQILWISSWLLFMSRSPEVARNSALSWTSSLSSSTMSLSEELKLSSRYVSTATRSLWRSYWECSCTDCSSAATRLPRAFLLLFWGFKYVYFTVTLIKKG